MKGFDFHRQKPMDNYICDFFCNELMLCIEFTHDDDEVYQKDLIKEKRLAELGISVLRFPDSEVYDDMENVIRTIEIWIERKLGEV